MNNLMFVFNAFVIHFLPFVLPQKFAGPFYVVNEGFFPRTNEDHIMAYETEIKPMKDDWEDKRINGWFLLKHKIKNLAFSLQSWKESGKIWLKRGPPIEFPNLCKFSLSMKNFMECFTGKLVHDPCSLDAGNYTLLGYTFEKDLRESVGESMFFGHLKYSVTISGYIESGERGSITFDMLIWIKDLENKQAKPGPDQNESKEEVAKPKKNKSNRNSKRN